MIKKMLQQFEIKQLFRNRWPPNRHLCSSVKPGVPLVDVWSLNKASANKVVYLPDLYALWPETIHSSACPDSMINPNLPGIFPDAQPNH